MSLSNYFYWRRLMEHYEAQASKCHAFGAFSFALSGIIVIVGLLLAVDPMTWLVLIIPIFGFIGVGIICMVNAHEAEDMVEYIKWRM